MSRRPQPKSRLSARPIGKPERAGADPGHDIAPGRRRRTGWAVGVLAIVVLAASTWIAGYWGRLPLFYARYHLTIRNDSQAIAWLELAERLRADPREVGLLRARVYRRWGDLDQMEKQLRTVVSLGADMRRVERERALGLGQTGQIDRVLDDLERWLADPGSDVADLADVYSSALEQNGRTHEAKLIISVWVADCPSDPRPHVQLARIAETEINPDIADQHYRISLEKNPEYAVALFHYGRFLLSQKQPEDAIGLLSRSLDADPLAGPAIQIALASAYRLVGKREIAAELLLTASAASEQQLTDAFLRLSTAPEYGEIEFELGTLALDEQRYDDAEAWFRKAIELSPDHFDAERQWGLTLQRLGKDREAAVVLARVEQRRAELNDIIPYLKRIKSSPGDFEARFEIAEILLKNGREERAIHYLDGVLVDAPEHEPTHRRLFEIYARKAESDPHFQTLANEHQQVLRRLAGTGAP